MDLQGKTAVISGGASGLGEATVREFVAAGANAIILDLNTERGEALVEELGDQVQFYKTDMSQEEQVRTGIEGGLETFENLHISVNCAGIGSAQKIIDKRGPFPLDHFQHIVNVNLIGVFNGARLAAEKMSQNDLEGQTERGVIINTASVAAFDGQKGQLAYSATKGAVVSMTLPMARDLASYGIRANTIAPGLMHTPLFMGAPKEFMDDLAKDVVFPKRLGQASEFARLARHIVENEYMNGETIRHDGGIRLKG